LASIAAAYGFSDWKAIYNDVAENAAFRRLRPDPNIINPGDELFIPEQTLGEVICATEKRHKFVLLRPTGIRLRIKFIGGDGEPMASRAYRLEVSAPGSPNEISEGRTSAEGLVDEAVSAHASEGHLLLWKDPAKHAPPQRFRLRLRHLDPIETVKGQQARLSNLGFNPGPLDGVMGSRTRAAVRAFQAKYGLEIDGIVGPRTAGRLREAHGW